MRDILFKAKRADNGEWAEGLLTLMWGQYHIINPDNENTAYPIDEETIGEYMGLTDNNGKKIFEGDILRLTDNDNDFSWIASVEFGNPNGEYNWGWQLRPITYFGGNPDILLWVATELNSTNCEIIGNIHDNAK